MEFRVLFGEIVKRRSLGVLKVKFSEGSEKGVDWILKIDTITEIFVVIIEPSDKSGSEKDSTK